MATFSTSVSASSHDARQAGGTVNTTQASLVLSDSDNYGGILFPNVTIPQGATINSATLTVNVFNTATDDPHTDIYCEAADNASVFSATSNNISDRPLTTAVVNWTATGIGGGAKNAPDLAGPVQEVVNRAGWASGNSLVFILDHLSTSSFRFYSYDSGSNYPSLSITYTEPAGGTNYPEAITLTRNVATTDSATMGAAESMSIGRESSAGLPGQAASSDSSTLTRNLAISPAVLTDLILDIILSRTMGASAAGTPAAAGQAFRSLFAFWLGGAAYQPPAGGVTSVRVTIGEARSVIHSGAAAATDAAALARQVEAALSGEAAAPVVVALGRAMGLSDDAIAGGIANVLAARDLDISLAGIADVGDQAVMAKAVDSVLSPSAGTAFDITLARALGVAPAETVQALAAYILAREQAATIGSGLSLADTLALTRVLGLDNIGSWPLSLAMTLTRQSGLAFLDVLSVLDAILLTRIDLASLYDILPTEEAIALARATSLSLLDGAGLAESAALARQVGLSALDGVSVLEAVALAETLGLLASRTAGENAALVLSLALAISGTGVGAQAGSLALARLHGIILPGEAENYAETLALARSTAVNVAPSLALAALLQLASARGIELATVMGHAVSLSLDKLTAAEVGEGVALWEAITAGRVNALDANALAAFLASIGLSRVESIGTAGAIGLFDAIGISIYRGVLLDNDVNIIITYRHVFVVDAENRVYIVGADTRDFQVEAERRMWDIDRQDD